MRVDSPGEQPCFSVCYAAYGYMADLVRSSESLRCLGSLRYGLAGAANLLRGRSYQAKIHYLPSSSRCAHRAVEHDKLTKHRDFTSHALHGMALCCRNISRKL